MEILIPGSVIQQHVRHAMSNSGYEVIGAFVLSSVGQSRISYKPGVNVSPDPQDSFEVTAEWIYSLIKDGADLLAFIHSHPGGQKEPSVHDITHFPRHYVMDCFIYYGDYNWITKYDSMSHQQVRIGDGVKVETRF